MGVDGYRWQMTAPRAPLARAAARFDAAKDEVVVAIAGCGVCHTDLGYLHGDVRTQHALPLALGHEVSGTVVEAGDDARALVGSAVIVPAVLPCGTCDACRRGLGTICSGQKMPGNDIDGGFATHIVVPARGLCGVDRARLERAGLTLAEVAIVADAVTTPYQAVRRAGVRPGSLAIVVGAGGVGGFCVQIAHALGATVVAIDVDAGRLALIEAHGADLTIDARGRDTRAIKSAIAAFAKERGLPSIEWLIFECSGTGAGQLTAYGLLVHGATLAVVGFTMEKIEIRLSNLMAFDARALGNWGCPPEHYPAALDLVLDRRIDVKPFVELRPLDAVNEVLAAADRHELRGRAVLVPA
ncbi:MAG: 6-hydroxycyclohex-1-ene-1-carbonyl-CoA dehydrogenase [Proteobacteria bacterium]|jgi:6-hydroxycyclohex-1-ene-1-carbonyl-CoA dehydrogenase|nr:6-hydroxycyclohex-1-ene-1-carbonyl-CoA dehydrogenase [Pseudomonadota bacterium]